MSAIANIASITDLNELTKIKEENSKKNQDTIKLLDVYNKNFENFKIGGFALGGAALTVIYGMELLMTFQVPVMSKFMLAVSKTIALLVTGLFSLMYAYFSHRIITTTAQKKESYDLHAQARDRIYDLEKKA